MSFQCVCPGQIFSMGLFAQQIFTVCLLRLEGFPAGSAVKNPPANAGDTRDAGSVPGSGRSPGEESGNPLQYSCLGNPVDRGAWWARVHGVTESQTRLSG